MAGFMEGVDLGQSALFPDRLDDWVGEDSLVRVVDRFVDGLGLPLLGFTRPTPARTVRPGYHPSLLLKLFIYGSLDLIPSRRRPERKAGRNVEVMWQTGKLVPDHKTIADVRRDSGAGNAAKGMSVKAEFVCDTNRDVSVRPAGEDLTCRFTTEERGVPIRRYCINGCKTCPLRSNGMTGNERRMSRWEREDLIDEMGSRLGRDPDHRTLRRCTVAQPFGTIKASMGSSHFLTRRLKNVRREMALNVLAYNIERMTALLGFRELMRAMQD